MAESMEQIRQKIKSTEISYKITKAMQLVATAKLKRVGKKIENVKPYYLEVYDTFHKLLPNLNNSNYIENESFVAKKTLWLVFNSNLGLCGGFNNNLNKLVLENFKSGDQIITVGNKAASYFKAHHKTVLQSYNDFGVETTYEQLQAISLELVSKFNTEEVDSVKVAYTKYVNSVTTTPTIVDLLPIVIDKTKKEDSLVLTEFEPSPGKVIETAIPLYIGALIYGTFVESQVSEQASRRLAMENASNNASDMKNKLLITYNRARQGAITQEISEIIGGADAQKS